MCQIFWKSVTDLFFNFHWGALGENHYLLKTKHVGNTFTFITTSIPVFSLQLTIAFPLIEFNKTPSPNLVITIFEKFFLTRLDNICLGMWHYVIIYSIIVELLLTSLVSLDYELLENTSSYGLMDLQNPPNTEKPHQWS